MVTINYNREEQLLLSKAIPEKTDTYTPVSNKFIIDSIHQECENQGFVITNKRYVYNRKINNFLGFYSIQSTHESYERMIAFQNSYNKSKKVAFISGINVRVCGNGCVFGDNVFIRKHTGDVNTFLVQEIQHHLYKMNSEFESRVQFLEQLKYIDLPKRLMATLAGRMFIEYDLLPANSLSVLKDEIINPSFNYNSGENLYSFYQYCTYALKQIHPRLQIDKLNLLYEFVKDISDSYNDFYKTDK